MFTTVSNEGVAGIYIIPSNPNDVELARSLGLRSKGDKAQVVVKALKNGTLFYKIAPLGN